MKTLFTISTIILLIAALTSINWFGRQSLPVVLIGLAFCASWLCYFYVLITEKEEEK